MRVVLFGYSYHPYTLDILEKFEKMGVNICALIEAQPKYSMKKVSTSSDIDEEFLSKVKLTNLISFWALKSFLSNPFKGISYAKGIYSAKKNKKQSKDPTKNIKIYKVNDHNSNDCETILKDLNPDIIVLGPASSIIKNNILGIPRIGVINAHMGLLPNFRGMNALEWTLFHLKKACVTIHYVDSGLDTGDIINTSEFPITNQTNVSDLRITGRKQMAEGLAKAIKEMECGNYFREKQSISDGKQYYSMHPKILYLVNTVLGESNKLNQ